MPAKPCSDCDSSQGLEVYRRAQTMELSDRRHRQGLQASCVSVPMYIYAHGCHTCPYACMAVHILAKGSIWLGLFLLPQLASLGACLPQPHHGHDSDGKADSMSQLCFLSNPGPPKISESSRCTG